MASWEVIWWRPVDLIPTILAQGYYFSVNEAMCRSRNGQIIIAEIPKDRILTETDAPYNERTSIRTVLDYMKMSEADVLKNFSGLLTRLKV